MSCGVGCRRGSDPALLWLWRRPVATAPIQPLAWEPPYVTGTALKKSKKTNEQKPPDEAGRIISTQILIAILLLSKMFLFGHSIMATLVASLLITHDFNFFPFKLL